MPISSATGGYAGDNAYDQPSKAKTGKDQLGVSDGDKMTHLSG